MKKLFLLMMMVAVSCVAAVAQPATGFYRVKNVGGAGDKVYAQMESNRYSSVMGTATSATTDASTVFYLELGSANSDGSYPITQLRSQMVNCPDQTAYIPMLLASLDEDNYNTLKGAFLKGVSSDEDKARVNALTLDDFKAWVGTMNIIMNLKADNGSYVVYDKCNDFPCGADMNEAMNVVWSNATLQAYMANLIDKVLPTSAEKKELNATFKSMIAAFRFGGKIYLSEDSNGEFAFTNDGTEDNAHWMIEDIDNTNYFAVAPDASNTDGDGKYYATIYFDFAVQLPEGVTAWYVSSVDENVAKCEQLEGSIVPRFLPVILECTSTSAADNILTPVSMTSALWTLGNTTRGNSLLDNNNVRTKTALADNSSVNFYPQTYAGAKNDKTHFRVLSVSGGKLGFYVYSGTTMEVNKAYLYLASSSNNAKGFALDFGSENGGVVTAIKEVETSESNTAVYDLQGRRVMNFNRDLPRGIYVVNGKKVIVR